MYHHSHKPRPSFGEMPQSPKFARPCPGCPKPRPLIRKASMSLTLSHNANRGRKMSLVVVERGNSHSIEAERNVETRSLHFLG